MVIKSIFDYVSFATGLSCFQVKSNFSYVLLNIPITFYNISKFQSVLRIYFSSHLSRVLGFLSMLLIIPYGPACLLSLRLAYYHRYGILFSHTAPCLALCSFFGYIPLDVSRSYPLPVSP